MASPATTTRAAVAAVVATAAADATRYRCMLCHDLGWVKRFVGPEPWRHEPVRCTCQQNEDSKARWEKARAASNMSQSLYSCAFANYQATDNGQAAYAVESWAHGPVGWIVLFGPFGTGKTHLLAAAFNVLVEEGAATGRLPLYTVVPDLLDHVRAGIASGDYGPRFAAVRAAPVLLLDDLGAEKGSAWTDEVLFKLLDHRYREQLPTLVATNCAPNELEGRIASRLQDRRLSTIYQMGGPDFRVTPPSQATLTLVPAPSAASPAPAPATASTDATAREEED